MAALTNKDLFETITKTSLELYEKAYPNSGRPILQWFRSQNTMDEDTLVDLGKYIISMLNTTGARRTKYVHFSSRVKKKVKGLLLECHAELTVDNKRSTHLARRKHHEGSSNLLCLQHVFNNKHRSRPISMAYTLWGL